MDEPTHECPGCGTPGVHNRLLACEDCWEQVPQSHRDWLEETYHDRREYPVVYHTARAEIMAWLRRRRVGKV